MERRVLGCPHVASHVKLWILQAVLVLLAGLALTLSRPPRIACLLPV